MVVLSAGVGANMISITLKRAIYLLGFTSVFLSVNVQAIALGKIQLYSTQQQSLQLQVELVEAEGVLPNSMAARVAGPAQFMAASLPYQQWYSQLDVKVVKEEGRYFIEVFGQQPVEQATLDLIFEVDYLGGRLLAEYAVTLPPFGSPITINESPIQPTPEQEVTATETLEAEVKLEEAVAQLVASQAETTELDTVVVAPPLVVVKPGQTLWRIAVNNSPQGISPWQTLMALYKANPSAYKEGDIRQLLVNSQLRLPTPEEVNALNAKQAKTAYDALIPAPVKKTPKPAVATPKTANETASNQPLTTDLLKVEQDKLKLLSTQSQALEEEVKSLQADYNSAVTQQELLATTNENLAQGVAAQEQGIKELNTQRTQLEMNMLGLDQQFESTQADLNKAEQDLETAKQELLATQEKIDMAAQIEEENSQYDQFYAWLDVAKIWAFIWAPALLGMTLVWWLIRRRKNKTAPPITPEIAETETVSLEPLTDYDSAPSAKQADLHTGAKKMQGGMPERSFIEELLREQEREEAELARQGFSSEIKDDQLHLSTDIEAMLTGQKHMQNQADEPLEYLTHEEEMNTKLDLASSYRDMGEISQSRAILQEIMQQGNREQKAQAQALLSSINKV